MELSKLLFILMVMMVTTISLLATPSSEELLLDVAKEIASDFHVPKGRELQYSLGGTSRFLAQKPRVVMTCDKYPRVCTEKGSPGPDCCKKECVNVMSDRLNCGMCGKKCKYSEMCCQGRCVNPSVDEKHCGSCNNSCKKGSSCVYGMCSYA